MKNCLENSVVKSKEIADDILKEFDLDITAATYQRSIIILTLNQLDRLDNKIYSNTIKSIANLLNLKVGTIRYKIYQTGYTPDDLLCIINTTEALRFLQSNTCNDDDFIFINKISKKYSIKENNYHKVKTMKIQTKDRVVNSKSDKMNDIVKSYIYELNSFTFRYKRNYQMTILLLSIIEYRFWKKEPICNSMLSLTINEIAYELNLSPNTIRDNIYYLNNITSQGFVDLLEKDINNNKNTLFNLFESNLKKDGELLSINNKLNKSLFIKLESIKDDQVKTKSTTILNKEVRQHLDKLTEDCSVGTYHRLLFVMRLNIEDSITNTIYLNCLDDISSYTNKARSTISDKYTRCINLNKESFLDMYSNNLNDVYNLFKEYAIEESYDSDIKAINFVFNNLLK